TTVVTSEADSDQVYIALETVTDYRRLLDDILRNGTLLRGVVDLRSLDAQVAASADSHALRVAIDRVCRSGLYLAQALIAAELSNPPALFFVTRGAVNVTADRATGGDPLGSLSQTPVWGLGKVLASEHDELQCHVVDLDPAKPLDATGLLDELLHGEPD